VIPGCFGFTIINKRLISDMMRIANFVIGKANKDYADSLGLQSEFMLSNCLV